MNRRTLLSLTTTAVIGFGFALLASTGSGQAQQSDTDKIKATIDAFHAALTSLDIRKMDDVWEHDPYVTVINPRDKTISWACPGFVDRRGLGIRVSGLTAFCRPLWGNLDGPKSSSTQ